MNQTTSFQKRLMQRLGIILITVFIVLSGVIGSVLFNDLRRQADQEVTTSLSILLDYANREMFNMTDSVIRVATSSTMLEYARVISTVPNVTVMLSNPTNIQREVLRMFDDLLRHGGDRFTGVRYISRDGQIWAQAAVQETEIWLTPVGENLAGRNISDLTNAITNGVAGQPYFSSLLDENGAYLPTLKAYVPIASLGNNSNILGVVELDIRTTVLSNFATDIVNNLNLQDNQRRIFLLDNNNNILLDTHLGDDSTEILGFLGENQGNLPITQFGNYKVAARILSDYEGETTPWRVVLVEDQFNLLNSRSQILLSVFAVIFVVLSLALALLYFAIQRVAVPIEKATHTITHLANVTPEQIADNSEFVTVSGLLEASATQIEAKISNLETDVNSLSTIRQRDLRLVSEINKTLTSSDRLERVLDQIGNIIMDNLDFYHTQIFLVDDARLNAVLFTSRGESGQALLAQNFKVAVGSNTVVGQTAANQRLTVAHDVRTSAYEFTLLSPEIKAELGLPLIHNNQLIGVLNIQTQQKDRFREQDIPTYQALADLITSVIITVRSRQQLTNQLIQTDTLNRQLTREVWEQTEQEANYNLAYQYNLLDVKPLDQEALSEQEQGQPELTTEIKIRGQVIGKLSARTNPEYDYVEGDNLIMQAVANRVALAIENARLFQETQAVLDETETLYHLSRYLNEAHSLDDIVKAIIAGVMRDASNGQVWIFDEYERGETPEYIELQAYIVNNSERDNKNEIQALKLYVKDHPFLDTLPSDQITLLTNVRQDPRLDSGLKLIFRRFSSEAVVIIPLIVRGQWRGIITMGFDTARSFNERELRLYGALSDQASVAIDNRLLLQQTEEEVRRNENLYAASRIINTAETMQDLVSAAVNTSDNPDLDFALGLLEPPYDSSGWPTQIRMVAQSINRTVNELDLVLPFNVDLESPMRHREPEIIIDDLTSGSTPSQHISQMRQFGHRFSALFPLFSANQPIAIFFVYSPQIYELDNADYETFRALTGQMSSQIQIRKLLEITQSEQRYLRSILDTMPTGVIVFDAHTLIPTQFNQQAIELLGDDVDYEQPFNVQDYKLYRSETGILFTDDETPIFIALKEGVMASSDHIAIVHEDQNPIEILMNAAPITDNSGRVTSIVVALQDITHLKQLEHTLQETLEETVALYEAQTQLTAATDFQEVLNTLVLNLISMQNPLEFYVILTDRTDQLTIHRSMMVTPDDPEILRPLLDVRSIVTIHDLETANLAALTKSHFKRIDAKTISSLPLNVSSYDYPIGWVVVAYKDAYSVDRERVLKQLRDATAIALDNRLLIASQEASLQEVQDLYNATSAISRSTDSNDLGQALYSALSNLNPDYTFVYVPANERLFGTAQTLLDIQPKNAPALDFATLFEDYDVPAGGVYIPDIRQVIEHVPAEEAMIQAGIRSFAALPIQPRNIEGGFILIAFKHTHYYSDSEDRYLNTLADGVSVILTSFSLYNESQSMLEETSSLYQASRALYEATSPEDIIRVAVDELISEHVNIVKFISLNTTTWLDERASADLKVSWRDGKYQYDEESLTARTTPLWPFMIQNQLSVVEDILVDDRLDDEGRAILTERGIRSFVIIPLRSSQRNIGAVVISSDKVYRYESRELDIYQSFGEQASLALEAVYLLEQIERRARQLQTSAEVSQSAAQLLDLEELFPHVVELIKDAFNYDHVQIFVMDEHDQFAELRASTGEVGQRLLSMNHKLEKGSASVIGKVTATGKPQISQETINQLDHKPNPFLLKTRSEIAVPLMIKDRVIGALDVQSNLPNAFSQEDMNLLTTLGSQISVAIDNANLYASAQVQAGRMQFLFEATTAAATAETLQETLEQIAADILNVSGSETVIIYQPKDFIDEVNPSLPAVKMLTPVVAVGIDASLEVLESINIEKSDLLLAEVARNRRAFIIDDISTHHNYHPINSQAQSGMILPLAIGSQLVGLIVVEDQDKNAYSNETIQLLLTLSGSVSAVVQSTELLEQLQATNEQLRELDRLKSDFLANMSHELRTPLNSIIGFSRVMLKGIDGPLTEMQEQDLTTIYNSGQHLLMLINDVLDQAKIAADKLDLKYAFFEIKPLVEGVKAIGIGLVKDKPINLRLELAPNMPRVYGDEFRTRQILLNLVSNASKFTQEGEIVISAYPIELPNGKIMVQIDIRDTGLGIAEKDLPLLFEAFRQVDSSLTRTVGGTGLGLPIARSLTEMQGGEMTVQSELNVGSVFSITIPTVPPEEVIDEDEVLKALDVDTTNITTDSKPDTQPHRHTSTLDSLAIPQGAKRIQQAKREVLLIEDNKDMVDQFRRILQREGFNVQTADHVAYAEAMVSNLRPNVIVMDVNFSEGDGWNILQRLKDRDDTFDIPIVIVSLSGESEKAYQYGAHNFIQRPFVPEQLVEAVLNAEKESNIDRILIIDDEPDAIRLLTQLLNENGTYRVFSAENGIEGISLIARRRPDLIILDLRMPDLDGFGVLQELRNNPETASIPVLVVTGEVDLKTAEQEQLTNVRVLSKTDISDEEFEEFISDVKKSLKS
jgi:GAF domain-containing protein/DNA-binding response OmpR family regulator